MHCFISVKQNSFLTSVYFLCTSVVQYYVRTLTSIFSHLHLCPCDSAITSLTLTQTAKQQFQLMVMMHNPPQNNHL